MRARAALVAELEEAGVRCEIGHVLASAGVTPFGCTGEIQGLHERRKRSAAGSMTIGANLIPACNWCNGWVEDWLPVLADENDPEWVLLATFLVARPGPGFDDLGKRAVGPPLEVHRCSDCLLPYCTVGPERGVLVAPCGHQPHVT